MALAHGLGHLSCFFPFLDVGEEGGLDVGTDVCAQVVVEARVVRVLDVELGQERLAVGGCWEACWCHFSIRYLVFSGWFIALVGVGTEQMSLGKMFMYLLSYRDQAGISLNRGPRATINTRPNALTVHKVKIEDIIKWINL